MRLPRGSYRIAVNPAAIVRFPAAADLKLQQIKVAPVTLC
jgi:hypothetical protein